jgi:glycosyltransferase involved in cell wall biosynthesis
VHIVQNAAFDLGVGPPASEREPVVVFMGTLMAEKGILDLLKAAPRIIEAVPETRFVIAGTWYREDEQEEANRFLVKHGLLGRFSFVGHVAGDDKAEQMRSAAAFVLPSKYPVEAQPFAVLDAMSAGTPVVVTRIGTTPEMIDDAVEGFMIDQGDVDALADRLALLLADGDTRGRMGLAARLRYDRDYTVESFARRLSRVWWTVLRRRGLSAPASTDRQAR